MTTYTIIVRYLAEVKGFKKDERVSSRDPSFFLVLFTKDVMLS